MKYSTRLRRGGLAALLFLFLLISARLQAQTLDAMLDISRFRFNDSTSILELNLLVEGPSVRYVKVAKNKFQARVSMNIEIADSAGVIRGADKLVLVSPVVADTAKGKPSFQTVKRFVLPNGHYTVQITTADANTKHPESSVSVPVALDYGYQNTVQLSDIQLLASYRKAQPGETSNPYLRNGYEMIASASSFFPGRESRLRFYTEIYHLAKLLGENEPLVVTYGLYPERKAEPVAEFSRLTKQQAQPVNVILAEMDIAKLPSGNYRLQVEVRDKQNQRLATYIKNIQRSNPDMNAVVLDPETENNFSTDSEISFAALIDSARLGFYLLAHQPLATTNEMSFITGLVKSGKVADQRRYLEHFWKRRSSNNPEAFWNDYRKRVDYVESNFATRNYRGYMTDRGRVYLQYGPPNIIHNEKTDVKRNPNATDVIPYQIWHYYHIGNQNNKVFVFVQKNLGNDNYQLTHSDLRGEINNPDWRNEVVKSRFSGSSIDR